jgi:hypothetical protein
MAIVNVDIHGFHIVVVLVIVEVCRKKVKEND